MRYPVIVADVPSKFDTYSLKGEGRAPKYARMKHSELLALAPLVRQVTARECYLFLWTSGPFVERALEIGKRWGFRYSTYALVWVKPTRQLWREPNPVPSYGALRDWMERGDAWKQGTGYLTRANAEIVLAFRTRNVPKRQARDVCQVICEPAGEHSAKPEEAQDRIERLLMGPYLELFARRERPGWRCLGYEVTGRDIRDDLARLTLE